MSYIVEQKIKGKIYLYEVESYWDKEKKQARQRRKYLGAKDPVTGESVTPRKGIRPQAVLSFGEVWLLRKLAERSGLLKILNEVFDEEADTVFNLACYDMLEKTGFHLYRTWAESTWGCSEEKIVTSQDISRFMADMDDRLIQRFQRLWLQRHGNRKAVAFDITSISSYANELADVEWGHNRDCESLPQINIGLAVNCASGLPVSYRVFPGSIPDVKVIKRLVDEFSSQVKLSELILDRGFFSLRNISELRKNGTEFLIGVPFSLKSTEKLLNIKSLSSAASAFSYNGRVLFHRVRKIEISDEKYDAHIYLDETRRSGEISRFINKIESVERELDGRECSNRTEAVADIESFAKGISGYFNISVARGRLSLERNLPKIEKRMVRMGKMILLSSRSGRSRDEILSAYFSKDMAEKFFDTLKNKMDNNRLRIHTDKTFQCRIFIGMIGLLIYASLFSEWKKTEMHGKRSLTEILASMKPLKAVEGTDGKCRLTEISKKQRDIMNAFIIPPPVM